MHSKQINLPRLRDFRLFLRYTFEGLVDLVEQVLDDLHVLRVQGSQGVVDGLALARREAPPLNSNPVRYNFC